MKIDDCGNFSKDLNKILEDFIKKEKKDGKEITEFDINAFDSALYNAYQNIKLISSDENVISDSMKELQQLMNSGHVNAFDVPKIATSITNEVVKENKIKTGINDTAKEAVSAVVSHNIVRNADAMDMAAATTVTAVASISIAETYKNNLQKVDNFTFAPETKKVLEENITKAKEGDQKASTKVLVIRRLEEIKELAKNDPEYLKNPMNLKNLKRNIGRLSALKPEESEIALINEIEEMTGISFIDENGNGDHLLGKKAQEHINYENMDKFNKKAQKVTGIDGKEGIDELEYKTKKDLKMFYTKEALEKAIEEKDLEQLQEIFKSDKLASTNVLKDKLKLCEQLPADGEKKKKIEEECMLLGNVLNELKEKTKEGYENMSANPEEIKSSSKESKYEDAER